jgi:hypothetical protein
MIAVPITVSPAEELQNNVERNRYPLEILVTQALQEALYAAMVVNEIGNVTRIGVTRLVLPRAEPVFAPFNLLAFAPFSNSENQSTKPKKVPSVRETALLNDPRKCPQR